MSVTMSLVFFFFFFFYIIFLLLFLWFYSTAEQDVATLAFLSSYDILPFSWLCNSFFFFLLRVFVRVKIFLRVCVHVKIYVCTGTQTYLFICF